MDRLAAVRLLLTNDDGIDAWGLKALAEAMERLGDVMVVAPSENRSGVSHGLTLHEPLHIREHRPGWISVSGTPADCVYVAVHHLCEEPPDVVVSGINRGANLGDDVHYSGTVGGAKEAALRNIPALAVSLFLDEAKRGQTRHYDTAARLAARVVSALPRLALPPRQFLNLNVPNVPNTPQLAYGVPGDRRYLPMVDNRTDPRGRTYAWIGGDPMPGPSPVHTDSGVVAAGMAALTPMHCELLATDSVAAVQDWLEDV